MATDSEIAPALGICSIILVKRFFNSFYQYINTRPQYSVPSYFSGLRRWNAETSLYLTN